ncbi:hypothetical protein [Ferrovibrio sp.]|uniref:hypothetical protein n=1 Tax=Ferrovibrio sp. TaxID=1917215 RepID=UPI003D0A5703
MTFNLMQDKTRQARTRAALNRQLKALYAAPADPAPEKHIALIEELAAKLAAQQQPQALPQMQQPLPPTPPGF